MIRAFLERLTPTRCAALALLLAAPALAVGLQADDFFHLAVLDGLTGWPELTRGPLDLFKFSDGDAASVQAMKERGMLTWWAAPDFRLFFFRPLSSLTHWLDHTLWPDSVAAMHLHSLVWLAGLVAVAMATYRRLLPSASVAGLAGLLYAIDDARALPAGWLANRNALLSGLFALLTLYLHDRWRRDGWGPGAVLGPLALILGLLSGEAAAAVGGFLFAYALFRDPGRGLLAVVPYAVIGIVWQIGYRLIGAGTRGSGLYTDPGSDPLGFLMEMPGHILTLLGGSWGLGTLEVAWVVDLGWGPAIVGLVLLITVLTPLWPLKDPEHRFWLLGTLLALIPASAVMPSDRLLTIAGFGAMGLLATSLCSVKIRRGPMVVLVLLNVVLAGVLLPARIYGLNQLAPLITRCADTAPLTPDIDTKTLVMLGGTDACAGYLSLIRMVRHQPHPERVWTLASSFSAMDIHRPDAHTLEVRPQTGWLTLPVERLLRDTDPPARIGDEVVLSEMTATVTEVTQDGRMAAVRFTFATPLEDARWVWMRWTPAGLLPWSPPPVGSDDHIALPMGTTK